MKTRGEFAVEKLLEGYNCAQAVFFSFCDDLHCNKDDALRLACGFGAGMARKQEVCGAVTGGILTIGLKYGRGEGQDKTATEITYRKVRHLMAQFETRYGSCLCRHLLVGCDLNTTEGQHFFKEKDLLNVTCKECVKTVVDTLEDIF